MNFKNLLNYPLLRGGRADRLSRPLIENPAVAIAAATAVLTGVAVVGPWATLGIAAFYTCRLDRLMLEGIKLGLEKAGYKQSDNRVHDELWTHKYDKAANSVREFVWQNALPDRKMNVHLTTSDNSLGLASIHPDEATVSLRFAHLCRDDVTPERAAERAKFIAGHELGHLQEISYLRLVSAHVAPRVAFAAAVLAVGAAGMALATGGALIPALVTAGMAALGTAGSVLAVRLANRQEEYRADRHAIRLTRNPQAGLDVLQIKQIDSGKKPSTKPSLMLNCLMVHPCVGNRAREMARYNSDLAKSQVKTPNLL